MCLILWNFHRRELEIVEQKILQDKEAQEMLTQGRMELSQILEECQRELEAAQSAQKARFYAVTHRLTTTNRLL
jgi:hypothetical protein